MCNKKLHHKFEDFLKERGNKIHSDTWTTQRANKRVDDCNLDWYLAKEKEIFIGEIIRKYEEIFGKIE